MAHPGGDPYRGIVRFCEVQHSKRGWPVSGWPLFGPQRPLNFPCSQKQCKPKQSIEYMRIHSFHIPVMGIAFTVDTPLKVAPLGIDSAISLVDDILLEKLRKMYCEKFGIPYTEIHNNIRDFRAKRITSYLNLIQELAQKKFERLKDLAQGPSTELREYIELLPKASQLGQKLAEYLRLPGNSADFMDFLDKNLKMGGIEVNIMTKLDRENHDKGSLLPPEYNDAHAALRGFAQSDLASSLILSAGMNPRL